MRTRIIIHIILFLFIATSAMAQKKYWIQFTDKDMDNYDYSVFLSDGAIENRVREGLPLVQESDAPLNKDYLNTLQKNGIKAELESRWFNAVSAKLNQDQYEIVRQLNFVKHISIVRGGLNPCSIKYNPKDYAHVLDQLGAKDFAKRRMYGKGVTIGVIDAGFLDADSTRSFKHIFDRGGVKETRDFLSPKRKDFYKQVTRADYHGRNVWRLIAGYQDSVRMQWGLAMDADFYLARTEMGGSESSVEEDAWIAAIEWMDRKGVRLVSSSLGYTDSFDDTLENHATHEMDGKTTMIARAAEIAAKEKGIFVVLSAGNEGDIPWRIISTPADAEHAFAIGACRFNSWGKEGYSSEGPDFTTFTKPDVVCYSTSGTSYSAPSMAGFIACIMGKWPGLTNEEVKQVIYKSSHMHSYPNNFVGHGVPTARNVLKIMDGEDLDFTVNVDTVDGNVWRDTIYTLPELEPVVFHKRNERIVIDQIRMEWDRVKKKKNGKKVQYYVIEVEKDTEAVRTTFFSGTGVTEIFWR